MYYAIAAMFLIGFAVIGHAMWTAERMPPQE